MEEKGKEKKGKGKKGGHKKAPKTSQQGDLLLLMKDKSKDRKDDEQVVLAELTGGA